METFKELITFAKEWLNHAIFREKTTTILVSVQLVPIRAREKPRLPLQSSWSWVLIFVPYYENSHLPSSIEDRNLIPFHFVFSPRS